MCMRNWTRLIKIHLSAQAAFVCISCEMKCLFKEQIAEGAEGWKEEEEEDRLHL